MAPYTNADFLSDQLRAAAPDADWNAAGVDRLAELSAMLLRVGVRDLTRLELIAQKKTSAAYSWQTPMVSTVYALRYAGGRLFGFIGTPNRDDVANSDSTAELNDSLMLAWSAEGHGNVTYYIRPGARGGFVIVPNWASSSDWGTFREGVKFLAIAVISFALPAAGFAVANTIGAAVVGPAIAASYPTVATIVGNVAIGTAFNGGNVELAVKGSLLSFAGAEIGGLVGFGATLATDAPLFGKLAASATSALVTGRDIKTAIAGTLLQNGASIMDDFTQTFPPEAMNPETAFNFPITPGNGGQSFAFDDPPIYGATQAPGDVGFTFGFDSNAPTDFSLIDPRESQGFGLDPRWNRVPALSTQVFAQYGGAVESPMPPTRDNFTSGTGDVINTISQAALSALSIVKAYRQLDNPQVLTQARATLKNGSVVSALDTGVIQTRDAGGRVSLNRPPVGAPQSTINGNVIVNNGDGTYTLVQPNGARRVIQYNAEAAGDGGAGFNLSSLPIGVILGGVGILFAVLKR